jgi:integrase
MEPAEILANMETAAAKPEARVRRNPRGVFFWKGSFWIRYADATGRIRRERATTRSAARHLYSLRKTQVLEGRKLPTRKPPVLLGTLVDDALAYSREHHSQRWQAELGYMLAPAREKFGGLPAEHISPEQIESFLTEHAKAAATRNRFRSAFSLVFRLATINGKVTSNPVAQVHRKVENNARERFLSPAEEARLRAVIREHFPEHEPEFDIALYAGLRASEMYGLDWANIDLFRGIITIVRSKHGQKRHVQLNDSARRAFVALAQRQPQMQGPIFPGWRLYQKWFPKACRLAGVERFRWHDLRHTFGSRLVQRGVPLRHVMLLMGHKSLTTTLRYSHLAAQDLEEAVRQLDRTQAGIHIGTDTPTSTGHSGEAASSAVSIQ